MADGVKAWSTTAATNATADSTINWAEGQAPSTVNDSARAMMAAIAKWRDDFYGGTTAGTSTAYTLTTNAGYDTLAEMSGKSFVVRFNATNGASPTLNVDGLGAKAIQSASGTAIATGAILANSVHYVAYDNSIPAFLLVGAYAGITGVFGGNVTVGGTIVITGVSSFAAGTVSAPGITFTGDTNLGLYRIGADNIGVTCNGAKVLDIATTGLGVTGLISSTTTITAGTGLVATTSVTGATVAGAMVAAQADQETATATNLIVTPGRQHFHPSACKAWGVFSAAGTLAASYNTTSVAKDATGKWTVTIATDLSSANYAVTATAMDSSSNLVAVIQAVAAGTFSVWVKTGGGTLADPDIGISFHIFGDI